MGSRSVLPREIHSPSATNGQALMRRSGVNVFDTIALADVDGASAGITAAAGTAVWGGITGTLSDQTDLQAAIDAAGVTDHGALTGLSDDDHSQYALLTGRAGGQSLKLGASAVSPVTDLHVMTTGSSDPRGILSAQHSTDTNGARVHLRKSRGSEASPTIVVTGDTLGAVRWAGYDGSSYLQMAGIRAEVTGTVATTRVPTKIVLSTGTDAAPSVLTDRVTVDYRGSATFDCDQNSDGLTVRNSVGTSSYFGFRCSGFQGNAVSFRMIQASNAVATGTAFKDAVVDAENGLFHVITSGTIKTTVTNAGRFGVGTYSPGAQIHSLATTEQLRLGYDASNYCSWTVGSGGNLIIAPSGGMFDLTGYMRVVRGTSPHIQFVEGAAVTGRLQGSGTVCGFTPDSGGLYYFSVDVATGAIAVNGSVTFADAKNIAVNTTTGTKIGTATTQKIGFWNATPVVQQVLATGAGATVDNVISLLQTLGLCKQS